MAYGPSPAALPWLASALCAVALWVMASDGFRRAPLPRGLLAIGAAVVLWAALPHLPLRPEVVMLAGGLLLVLLCAAAAREAGLATALQAGVLAAAAINALIAIVQYFGGAPALAPWVNQAVAGEAFGNLRQPNQFATLCWLGAAVVLFGTLRLPRAAAPALLVLLATASAATVSRTALLEALLLLVLAAAWRGPDRRRRLLLWGLAAAVHAAAAVALPFLLETGTGLGPERTLWGRLGADLACFSRRVLWSNVLQLIALHPWAGWGWGELDRAHFLTLYDGARFCEILDNAHNLPLHLAVELGVPASLVATVGAGVWAWRQRPWQEPMSSRQLAWALLGLLLLHSLLEYPLWYGSFQLALGIALGWLLEPASPSGGPVRWRAAAGTACLLGAIAYASWDYARVSQIYLEPEQRWPLWRDDTLARVRPSWLFAGQARFAELTLSTPDRRNAEEMYALAQEVLHYSPEPRVIERLIEAAVLSGREDEAVLHLARYRAAFPREYQAWRERQARALPR